MGDPNVNGIGQPDDLNGNGSDTDILTAPSPQNPQALFSPQEAQSSFTAFKQAIPQSDLTQDDYTDILTTLAEGLMSGDYDDFTEAVETVSGRIPDDHLYQMAGVIPEPMQSRLRALVEMGGSFDGVAVGESTREAARNRTEKDKRAEQFATLSVALYRQQLINEAVEDFKKDYESLVADRNAGRITDEQFIEGIGDKSEDSLRDAKSKGASNEDLEEIAEGNIEQVQKDEDIPEEIKADAIEAIRKSLKDVTSVNNDNTAEYRTGVINSTTQALNAYMGLACTANTNPEEQSTTPLAALSEGQGNPLTRFENACSEAETLLSEIESIKRNYGASNDLDELEQQTREQLEIATLQRDAMQSMMDMQNQFASQGIDLAKMTDEEMVEFVRSIPPEMIINAARLSKLTGNTNDNPFKQALDAIEKTLQDEGKFELLETFYDKASTMANLAPEAMDVATEYLADLKAEQAALQTHSEELDTKIENAEEGLQVMAEQIQNNIADLEAQMQKLNDSMYSEDGTYINATATTIDGKTPEEFQIDYLTQQLDAAHTTMAVIPKELRPENYMSPEEQRAASNAAYEAEREAQAAFSKENTLPEDWMADIESAVDELNAKDGEITQDDIDAVMEKYNMQGIGPITERAEQKIRELLEEGQQNEPVPVAMNAASYSGGTYASAADGYEETKIGKIELGEQFAAVQGQPYQEPTPGTDLALDEKRNPGDPNQNILI